MCLGSICLIGLNHLIVSCLYIFSAVQICAWTSTFTNSSDVDVHPNFTRMQRSMCIGVLLSCLSVFCHILCAFGFRGMMKLFRRITVPQYIQGSYNSVSFGTIFAFLICPSERVQTLVTNVFQVSSFSSLFHFTSPIFKDEYSLTHLPTSLFLLECVTAVFAVQHLVLLVVLYRCKPPNFDLFKYGRDETENTSRPAPPPYAEIDKPMPIQGEATVPL